MNFTKMINVKKKEDISTVDEALAAAITPIGIDFERNTFRLGENYCRIYCVIKYPNEVNVGWLSKITNIAGTTVSVSYKPIDNGLFVNAMSKASSDNSSQSETTKDALQRSRYIKTAADAEKIMKQIDQNQETAGAFVVEIMVISREKEDFIEKCAKVESTANAIGCRVRILSCLQKEAFMHLSPTYPLQAKVQEIAERPFLLSTFTGGYPYSASGFYDATGYYLGKNGLGGVILFDPWIRNDIRVNSNITIIGDSGMGKSTALKHIIYSEIARGTKVIIIDLEGEYREICRSPYINGKWIDVAGGRGGVINPFQVRPVPKDDDEEDDEDEKSGIGDLAIHLKTLETFFQLYVPSLTTNDKARAILNKLLIELYEKKNITWDTDVSGLNSIDFPTFDDLYALIKEKVENCNDGYHTIYQDLLLYITAATTGADKGLWNGITTADNDSPCICLDTKSVMDMGSNVLAAQYYNVLSWAWQQLSRDRKQRVMIVADECWAMIDPSCPQSLKFLRNAEKRARKYEGAIVVSTQQISDFLDPAVKLFGQAVLDLPNTKLLFGLDGKGLQEAKDIFMLNGAQYDLVSAKRRGTALMRVGAAATKIKFEFSDERLAMFGSGGGR